jgi:hypothetical protein
MRKSALICVLFFVISFSMWAYPAPMWRVGNSKSTPLDPSALHIDENDVYILDRKSNQVMAVDSETGTNSRSLLRLGKSAVITDLFVRDRQIYLLDSKRSGVLVVDTSGSYLRDFFTSGNPGLRFKNPKRILVNYQGYIYILDDWGIRGFTMEGVPFVSAPVNSAISMSLGEDQLLRVLRHSSKGQVVEYLDQNLKIVSASMVMIQDRRSANIADLAINQWGEMHVINRDATNIGKLGPMAQSCLTQCLVLSTREARLVCFSIPHRSSVEPMEIPPLSASWIPNRRRFISSKIANPLLGSCYTVLPTPCALL